MRSLSKIDIYNFFKDHWNFQAYTYACYYKSSADLENERKDRDITVILVKQRYPLSLVRYLESRTTGPAMTSRATYKRLSGRALITHFTSVICPRSTSMQVMQRGWTQLPVLQ